MSGIVTGKSCKHSALKHKEAASAALSSMGWWLSCVDILNLLSFVARGADCIADLVPVECTHTHAHTHRGVVFIAGNLISLSLLQIKLARAGLASIYCCSCQLQA